MIALLTLGARLTWHAGRAGRARVLLMASGSAVAAFVVLTALALTGMADRQQEREARIAPAGPSASSAATSLRGQVISDGWASHELRRVVLAVTGPDAPVPPGLDRLPGPGEAVLSPALAELVWDEPLVARRFPQPVIGTVSETGLVEPSQLLAYVGVGPTELGPTATPIAGFGDPTASGNLDPRAARMISLLVLLTLVAPVLIFIVTCARLSATARDQRLASLRLIGLTPGKTQLVNAIETGAVSLLGSTIGAGAWFAWRLVDPAVEVGAFAWYSTDLRLTSPAIVTAVAGLVALAVTVGALGSRASIAQPMRTRRERSVRTVSRGRVVPLVAGVALLSLSWATSQGRSDQVATWMVPFGTGLIATAAGLVLIVPFAAVLTGRLLQRSSRPAALLAGGRLRHEPAVAGRVVAGLAFAIFAAGFAQVVLVAVDAAFAGSRESRLGPAVNLTAWGPPTQSDTYRRVSDLGVAMPHWQLGARGIDAIVATCDELRAATATALPGCRDGEIYRGRSLLPRFDGEPPADVDAALRQAGLPPASGELEFDIAVPDGAGTWSIVVPPSLAPPTHTRFVVPFTPDGYDPQVATAALAQAQPAAWWSPLITAVDRLDSARIYSGIIAVGTVAALVVGLAALVVATVDRALERRHAVAHLAALGTPPATIRFALILQTLPVTLAVLTASGAAAIVGGSSYLRWGDPTLGVPVHTIGRLLAIAVCGAFAATVAALAGSAARPQRGLLRNE